MTDATVQGANPIAGGKILRDSRLEQQVSTSNLADVCKKTPTHISEIEHGRRTPSPELLEAICDQLKIDGQKRLDIFCLFGQMPPEVEEYIGLNRNRVIKSVQRMIAGDRKDGKWPPDNGSAKPSGKKKKAKSKNSAKSKRSSAKANESKGAEASATDG